MTIRYSIMYEVTCNGFDAKKQDTSHHILWVYATSKDVIALALEKAELMVKDIFVMRGKFDQCDFDMRREDEYEDFLNRVRDLGHQHVS